MTAGKNFSGNGNPPLPIDDALLQALGLDELLPERLAAWRPLLIEALSFFLNRLPEPRIAAIVADQLALPAEVTPGRRLAALFALCPVLHKVGQVLARHAQLPAELRRQLQVLESMPASVNMADVLASIRAEIGEAQLTLANEALAEGSVAVVVPFTYRKNRQLRHGVFKVLKPGVEARVAVELLILAELEKFLELRGRALGLPALDYRDTLGTVRRLLLKEIDCRNEQANLRAAAAFYADEPRILIPALLPWSTPRLTAMTRVFGGKLSDARSSPELQHEQSDTLVAALIGQPFWNAARQAIFHADLHAGNLLLADDGRLAIIDWSLTAQLSKIQREAFLDIALGGLTLDAPRICRTIAGLGGMPADDPALAAAVDQALDRLVFDACRPGFDWLMMLLDDVVMRGGTRFEENFLLFRKSWFSLFGVLGELTEQPSPDSRMLQLGMQRFLAELPARLLAPPDACEFSTHVSNVEILQVCASPWLAALRYWTRRRTRPPFA